MYCLTATMQECQVVVGGMTLVKIPLTQGKQNDYAKKMYQFNSGTSQFLTLGVKNVSVDFLCIIWARAQNEPSFLSWEKIGMPFQ